MNVHATGLNIEYTARWTLFGPKLRNLAEAELNRIDRMLGGAVSAHVILTEDKYRKIAEVTLNTCSETLVATCEHTDMMTALHDVLKKIDQQAVKHKERKLTVERQAKPASSAPLIEVVSPSALAG